MTGHTSSCVACLGCGSCVLCYPHHDCHEQLIEAGYFEEAVRILEAVTHEKGGDDVK